ncbi:MAG: prepilin peptidase [Anaerolineales bacterium]|nr:prepilin peptidase [Anaerolineales bacterium]
MHYFILLWLVISTFQDWRTRQVSNWLTLPVLVLAGTFRITGFVEGNLLSTVIIALAALVGWRLHLIGGADAKGLIALALLDSRLAILAWAGAVMLIGVKWLSARCQAKQKPHAPDTPQPDTSIPGFLGFLLGTLAYLVLR